MIGPPTVPDKLLLLNGAYWGPVKGVRPQMLIGKEVAGAAVILIGSRLCGRSRDDHPERPYCTLKVFVWMVNS